VLKVVYIIIPQKERRICADNTKSTPSAMKCSCNQTSLLFDDFSSFVRAAYFADMVSKLQLSALLAFNHARHLQFEMSTAHVATSFGRSPLRYCHESHLLTRIYQDLKKSARPAIRGSIFSWRQSHGSRFRLFPQTGQSPLQASSHKGM